VQLNSLPAFAGMEKSKNTVQATKDSEADAVGYAEIGVNIPNLKEEDSIHARFQHKLHAPKVNFASNRHHQSTSVHLQGGVGIVTTFEATTRHKGVGNDPTGLAERTTKQDLFKPTTHASRNGSTQSTNNTPVISETKRERKTHTKHSKRTSRQRLWNGWAMETQLWCPSMQIRTC
jgi:hypothetical protein